MATLTPVMPRWVGNTNGKMGMARKNVIADGSATWKAGHFLRQDADGLVYLGTTGAASGVGADAIQYQALSDLNAATGDETGAVLQEVAVIDPGDVFEMNEKDGAVGIENVGQHYAMTVSATTCLFDEADSTNAIFEVVNVTSLERPYGPDATADVYGRATVKVLNTAIQAARS